MTALLSPSIVLSKYSSFLRGGFSLMMALHFPSIVLSLSSSFLRGGFSLMMALHSPSIVENRDSLGSKVLSGASDSLSSFCFFQIFWMSQHHLVQLQEDLEAYLSI